MMLCATSWLNYQTRAIGSSRVYGYPWLPHERRANHFTRGSLPEHQRQVSLKRFCILRDLKTQSGMQEDHEAIMSSKASMFLDNLWGHHLSRSLMTLDELLLCTMPKGLMDLMCSRSPCP